MILSHLNRIKLSVLIAAVVCILGGYAWILDTNFQKVNEQQDLVIHTTDVIIELESVLSSCKDAETGVRGYLLTFSQDYLEPYHRGVLATWAHINKLKTLTADNPAQQIAIANVQTTIEKRFAILDNLLRDFETHKKQPKRESLVYSEGKATMDVLREQINGMVAVENKLLAERSQVSERSKYIFFWMLVLMTTFIAVVIISGLAQLARNQQRVVEEARLNAEEAKERETIGDLSQLVAGDISIEEAGTRVLEFFSKNIGVLAGRIFMLDQNRLSTVASYGIKNSEKSVKASDAVHDKSNMVGSALKRSELWEVTDVPDDYWFVSSSLGASVPKSLIFIPLIFQGRPLGVIELAAFKNLTEAQRQLLSKMTEVLSVNLHAAQSRGHLQMLFERTQQQAEELQAQQEELRTNNEELEQQARALESQQQALSIKNNELELAQQELQRKATELESSSRYKSEFLAKMSHELRTPLNGLLILSTLLIENKEKNLTEQQREFARSINSSGNDLLMLINDILDLAKIEARKLSLKPDDFSIEAVVNSMKQTFDPQVAAKGLKFETQVVGATDSMMLHTDRQRLNQILRNFLSNAVKFTEAGQITLKIEVDSSQKRVNFSVADTGIGIPEAKLKTIFEAFEQVDGSISRKYGGTGLGLTISRELATLLGGTITVESLEGSGSRFNLNIPIELKVEPQPAESTTPLRAVQMPTSLTVDGPRETPAETSVRVKQSVQEALQGLEPGKKTILVVEDDERFRTSIVEIISGYGFQAIQVGDGEVALALLNQHVPDAILLDIKLPGISGLGILEMIKQLPHLRHIPVHMISALEYQHNALRMGALGYLTKPVTTEKVKSAVERIENMISKNVRRLLLIEDDDRQNSAISDLISGNDIEVVGVKTGRAAVEKLKEISFDCIILDLTLPDVSGFDVLKEITSLEISVPPIVIYTGKDLSDEEEAYLRKYSESIVIKGAFSPDRLLDEVNLFLHRVESYLPNEKREMLSQLRAHEKTFEGKTILLVDDDIRNIFALTSALESKGLKVRVGRNGLDALNALEAHSDIDLVLMDIMMPKMDGFEAMRQIRVSENERIRKVPVVALTAKAMKEDHERCMEAGANDYLPKPVNLDNLMTVLKVWLTQKGFN